jgi:hypothetical protein
MGHPPKKSSSVSPHADSHTDYHTGSTVDKLGAAMNGKGSADLSGDTFGFTISGTSVTAMSTLKGTGSYALKLPANASFVASTVNGVANVTETITRTDSTETLVFAAESATSTAFHRVSDTVVFSAPTTTLSNGSTVGYEFVTTNGSITDVQKTSTVKGVTRSVDAGPSGAIFTKNADGSVTETFVQGNAIETIKFVQPSGSTLFAIASDAKSFVPLGASTTRLDVHPEDRLDITLTGDTVTAVQSVAANDVKTSVALSANLVFQELTAGDPSLIQALATRNGQTSYELFLKSTTTGLYTEIAHGSGTTVDLVGVQAQLHQLPADLLGNL